MTSKTLYILRHGQTDLNKKGMVQGRGVDSSLNERGREQARKTFEALKHIPFDQVYTSKLKRTHETVAHFDQSKVALEGFDEISWGSQEGVVPTDESKTLYAKTLEEWCAGNLNANLGGGESPIQVMNRQREAMKVVLEGDHSRVLICMHGRAMRILLSWLTNSPLEQMDQFEHANCCYYKLQYDGRKFDLIERNVTVHLD